MHGQATSQLDVAARRRIDWEALSEGRTLIKQTGTMLLTTLAMLLGIVLMVAEIFTPSLGALGIGGAVSFVLGALLLVDTDTPAYEVSLPLVAGVAVASLGMTFLIGRLALRSRRAPVVSGVDALIGRRVQVLSWNGAQGYVMAEGERWRAQGPAGLAAGDPVVIESAQGLTLRVRADAGAPH